MNKYRRCRFIYYLIIIFILCWMIFNFFIKVENHSYLKSTKFPFVVQDNVSRFGKILSDCQPFTNKKQYQINIDGVVYPRHLPKAFNKTINYVCLNKNKKRNRILLWNTFVGRIDFYYGK